MNDLNARYAFAERWYARRLRDAFWAHTDGFITDREYWDMVSDDALVVLAYRARIKVQDRQEAHRKQVEESLQLLSEGLPPVALLTGISPAELEELGGIGTP